MEVLVDTMGEQVRLLASIWPMVSHSRIDDFEKQLLKADLPATVDKVVCFELTPLLSGNHDWNNPGAPPSYQGRFTVSRRGAYLHFAALRMAKVLEEKSGHPIRVYVQDARYTQPEIELLERMGITVVDGAYGAHEGFLMIDENTVVFSVLPNGPVRQLVMETSMPAAMVCTPVNLDMNPDPDILCFPVSNEDINGGQLAWVPGSPW